MSTSNANQGPEHFEPKKEAAKPASNPSASLPTITLSVPQTINVKMVDASTLMDYEIWTWISSALLSLDVGFIVAVFQDSTNGTLKLNCGIFSILLLGSMGMTGWKRWKLQSKSQCSTWRVQEEN